MKNWILAFDAGCSACRDVVGAVQEITGPVLAVRSLADPEVRELRERALGAEAPWAPTLLAVDGTAVRAWVGPALSLRLARLLGPARSVRVVRSLSATGAARGTVTNTGRRRLLLAAPGAAAAALVITGGGGVAWGASSTKVPLLEAIQRRYGLDPNAIEFTPNTRTAAAAVARSKADTGVTALRAPVQAVGAQVREPSAYVVRVPLQSGVVLPLLDLTSYPIYRSGQYVGQILNVSGPQGSRTVSALRRSDGSTELLAHDSVQGLRERVVVASDGTVVEGTSATQDVLVPMGIPCSAVCQTACDAWWGLGIPGCVAACVEAGPADPVCAALCGLIVTGVCNFWGCNVICCSCCGEC